MRSRSVAMASVRLTFAPMWAFPNSTAAARHDMARTTETLWYSEWLRTPVSTMFLSILQASRLLLLVEESFVVQ